MPQVGPAKIFDLDDVVLAKSLNILRQNAFYTTFPDLQNFDKRKISFHTLIDCDDCSLGRHTCLVCTFKQPTLLTSKTITDYQ
jgi:hypothetical protein